MRTAIGLLMILHGIAHGAGFAAAFHLNRAVAYKTTILGGQVDVGATGIRVFGVMWLLVGVGVVLAGLTALAGTRMWESAAAAALIASTILCVTELPDARIGIAVNVLIAVGVLVGLQLNWLT